MRHSLPSGFAPWPRGRSLRVPKLSLRAEMALQAYQGLPVFLSGAHSGFAPVIGLTLVLRWGLPLTPPGRRSEVDEPRLRDGQPPLLLPGQRSCQPHGLFFWPFLGGLHAGPRAHLDGGGLEPHRALSTVLDTVPAALGTSERESDGEASGSAGSALSSTPRLGPGRAARTVAVPTWLCGRSARQHGPGDQERSVFESPHFWSLGLRSRLSEPCLGGGGGVRRAWGPSALVPEGPFLLQCVLRAGPSGRGPWPRGARPTGRLSRAAWCSCQARDSKTRLPGLHPALGNLASTGSDSAKESLLHAPSPHLPVLPFSSGVVVRAQLQCRHVRTLGPEVTRALNAPDPTGHPTPDSGGFARDRVRRL